jgi:hypothetical protein
VGQHADQLLVGSFLRLAQFLGQFLEQEKAAPEAPVDERAAMDPDPASAPDGRDMRLAVRQCLQFAPKRAQIAGTFLPHSIGVRLQQPQRGGVRHLDPAVEVEHDDAAG